MTSTDLSASRMRGTILPVSALLLFCAAMLALWVAHSQMTTLRFTNQELRMRELFAAAGAGLEAALAEAEFLLEAEPDFDASGRFRIPGPSGTHEGWRYESFIHNETLFPFERRIVEVEARALDDSGGLRLQRQQARLRPWLASIPSAPLIAHRAAALPGSVSLRNIYGDVLAWSGGAFIAPDALLDALEPVRCPPTGICEEHGMLAALDSDAAFAHWFRRARNDLRTASARHADVEWKEAGGTVVIEGMAEHGSADAPQLLIIAGDLEVRGTLSVHGLLYVDGVLTAGTGNITVSGALIVAGDAMHQGSLLVDYEPGALQALAQRGTYARIPGSWIDF